MNNKRGLSKKQGVFRYFAPIWAIAVFFLASYLVTVKPNSFWLVAGVCTLLYVGVLLLVATIAGSLDDKSERKRQSGPMITGVMYEKINSMDEPALLCDSSYKIIWANKFVHKHSTGGIIGTSVQLLFDYDIKDGKIGMRPRDIIVPYKGKSYLVEEEAIRDYDKRYYLLTLRDVTELLEIKQKMADEDKIVSYVIVDNLEDLLQFEQERYREAANKIEGYIREWGASVGGLVKEYERDKYMFIFEAKYLDGFMKGGGFDEILEKIRDIRVGSGNISVTVSIGVAKVSGTMEERESAAHVALDMALQRGGDQVVVKLENRIEFFGGKLNSVQRRTKVRARVVGNELISLMAKAGNVIVMGHRFPDYDAIGASIGIARLAMFCGVKVNIVTNFKDSNVKKSLKFFADDEDYKGIFVDSSRGLDLVRSDTLLVVVDVNNTKMFESEHIARNVNDIVIIDHHRKTAEFEKEPLISYIEASSSSASELVTEILEQSLPVNTLNQNEANMLYAGIVLDTKQFSKCTGTKTYAAAMYLRDHNASYESIQDLFKTSLRDYKLESRFGEKIQIYRNCMAIAVNEYGSESSDRILGARVADNLLMLEGVKASFSLVQIDNMVYISARSDGTVNVQLILEDLGGGGRFEAAGGQVTGTVNTVLNMLLAAIDNRINPED
ncbi:MAG: DHH family phosphoesterase [Clostridia bacterium]|nr:DHH family phosphoesterase [Clostridia bacterium]